MNYLYNGVEFPELPEWDVELNPLLQSIPIMILYKVFVVGILCWWLGKRKEKIAHIGLIVCTVWFGAVNLWHIYNIFLKG
jgi:hypothetical protein